MSDRLEDIRARAEAEASKPDERDEPDEVLGAVARGWCWEANSHKEMDVDLAQAIAEEVRGLVARERSYLLDRLERAEALVKELETRGGPYCRWCGSLADWCEENIERTHGSCCKKCTHRLWRPETPFAALETGELHE